MTCVTAYSITLNPIVVRFSCSFFFDLFLRASLVTAACVHWHCRIIVRLRPQSLSIPLPCFLSGPRRDRDPLMSLRALTTSLRATCLRSLCTRARPSRAPKPPGHPSYDAQHSRPPRPHTIPQNKAGPYETPTRPRPAYPKRKSPFKRATSLCNALDEEECLRMISNGRAILPLKLPNPLAGDIVRIAYREPAMIDVEQDGKDEQDQVRYFAGIVIAFRRRGLGSTLLVRNVVENVPVERGFPYYSPLVVDAWHIGRVRRRVRTKKLYYIRKLKPRESRVPNPTGKPPS